jgi:hypothetical protein
VGCPQQLSDGKHDGTVAVKRVEEEEKGGCSTVGAGGGRGFLL